MSRALAAGTLDQLLASDPELERLVEACREPGSAPIVVGGVAEGAWGLLAEQLRKRLDTSVLVVAADPQAIVDDLLAFDGVARPLHYPAADVLPMDRTPPADEIVAARLTTQDALLQGRPALVAASPLGLARPAPSRQSFGGGRIHLTVGSGEGLERLVSWLVEWGYSREPEVEARGQFAMRGGIVDVFPQTETGPLRIEFFGDAVESIRGFEITSQASITRLNELTLLPAREFPHRQAEVEAALQRLRALDFSRCLPEVAEQWREHIAHLAEAGYFPGVETLYPYLSDQPSSLFDYFAQPPLVMMIEPARLVAQAERQRQETEALIATEAEHGELPGGLKSGLIPMADLEARFGRTVHLERVAEAGAIDLDWHAPTSLVGRPEAIPDAVGRGSDREAGQERVIFATRHLDRLEALAQPSGAALARVEELDVGSTELPTAVAVDASLRTGFTVPAASLTVYSDLELFGLARPERRRRQSRGGQASDASAAFRLEIQPGQLVVHRDHGVGLFQGLRSIDDGGAEREYLHLEYAGGDRVFVPVEHMDRIQLYVGGAEGEDPKLNRLGTGEWDRTKRKVRQAVAEMAGELIEIYAKREVAQGHAFAPDGPWQSELEMAFPYQETPDQLRAIDEIKADMESTRPMDRLLCGDVGFGKTEVALRAAFKAATDGKQVAVLVPTTVLANQHFLTFSERLKPYPVRVEMLSRFRSDDEAEGVRAGLADGTVDIVIATHRILSGRVRFKDLGLLIVDEEQRFGVAQKERLKRMRASVDVLSMSATPIPRTLHMSLGGLRDLSVLATPPEERVPIRTFVTADADNLVREVMVRELNRERQAFFVHNRVRTIKRAADRVRRLVPEARVAVAHGQMEEGELARVMTAFVRRDFDVLVCTTIIESGLDIPTADAIMVQDADRFGLADLYQLRGRVGRSGERAYAYFLYDPQRSLTEHADKRLDVIGEYQELGSGFKLALKDLEIRGAGNLLGREQSGEIAAVGLEMYNQMLRDAVGALRAEVPTAAGAAPQAAAREAAREAAEVPPVTPLELPLDHYLPHEYVPNEKVRLQVYQQLAAAATDAELQTQARRLKDRFGAVPGPVENLLFSLRVKLAAQAAGIRAVHVDDGDLELRLAPDDGRDLGSVAERHRHLQARRLRLRFAWREAGSAWQDQLLRIIADLGAEARAA
ncbi:MAG TPA: transcription-repair coupling factor [Candidatus Solibacter sp.]|nr:transcription-repair coupling factor [Candidatus Solibacter sp.]